MPSPRSAGLAALVILVMTSLVTGGSFGIGQGTAYAQPYIAGKEPNNLNELRREAERVTVALETQTAALEERRAKLKAAQDDLALKLKDLQVADAEVAKIRKPLSQLIGAAYQQPGMTEMPAFLVAGGTKQGEQTLRAMTDIQYLADGRDVVVRNAASLTQQRELLAGQAQELRAANLLSEAQLNRAIVTLRQQSDQAVKALTDALNKIGIKVDRAGRAALGCDPGRVKTAAQYPNGLIPEGHLCPLVQEDQQLRADAAIAFIRLNELYKAKWGSDMCVSDSYRSLADQQAVYRRKPGMAAVPGRSNHGWGLAVDLCGPLRQYHSTQWNWLEATGLKLGWIHPSWAKSGPFEPWHWEYDPGQAQG